MGCHTYAIELQRVSTSYPGQAPVLTDVSFVLAPGELLAVLGPNGAGKSSLVRLLTGLLTPTQGTVRLFGRHLRSIGRRKLARRVAVVPQSPEIAFDFCVQDVVMMGRAPHQGRMLVPSSEDRAIVDRVLGQCDLLSKAHQPVQQLSGGEQTRVAIARALAQRPEVLILDESTAHLDVRHSVHVHSLLRREVQDRGLACLFVLHDLNEAAQNADRVLLLRQGHVVAQGNVPEVMTRSVLLEAFGIDLYVGVNEFDSTRYFLPLRPPAPP